MPETLKKGSITFLRILLVQIMCLFTILTFNLIALAALTEEIGYTVYSISDTGVETEEYTHFDKDGVDTKLQEYEDKDIKITKYPISSELSKGEKIFLETFTQIFCLIFLITMIYPYVWNIGTVDCNLIKFKHIEPTKLKGLYIGLIAVIPIYLILTYIAVMSLGVMPDFPIAIYKFLNPVFYSLSTLIIGGAVAASELSVIKFILLFIVPLILPVITHISYTLGVKNISLSEKMIYKETK